MVCYSRQTVVEVEGLQYRYIENVSVASDLCHLRDSFICATVCVRSKNK